MQKFKRLLYLLVFWIPSQYYNYFKVIIRKQTLYEDKVKDFHTSGDKHDEFYLKNANMSSLPVLNARPTFL